MNSDVSRMALICLYHPLLSWPLRKLDIDSLGVSQTTSMTVKEEKDILKKVTADGWQVLKMLFCKEWR